VELDARGRRLRAALAALLVRHNASELRLVREGSTTGPASEVVCRRDQGRRVVNAPKTRRSTRERLLLALRRALLGRR
jgi:hypothetical protein